MGRVIASSRASLLSESFAAAVSWATSAAAVPEEIHEFEELFLLFGGQDIPYLGDGLGAEELHLDVELGLRFEECAEGRLIVVAEVIGVVEDVASRGCLVPQGIESRFLGVDDGVNLVLLGLAELEPFGKSRQHPKETVTGVAAK